MKRTILLALAVAMSESHSTAAELTAPVIVVTRPPQMPQPRAEPPPPAVSQAPPPPGRMVGYPDDEVDMPIAMP